MAPAYQGPSRSHPGVPPAFCRTWPHYDRVSAAGSFEAYVRRTMFTTYASWWRRRWRGELPAAQLPETTGQVDEVGSANARHDVRRALAALSRRQRAVVVLRYFDDRTESETAQVMGCSVGAVKSHHARAIRAVRGSPLLETDAQQEAR